MIKMIKRWEESEVDYLFENYFRKSNIELASYLNKTEAAIRFKLWKLDLSRNIIPQDLQNDIIKFYIKTPDKRLVKKEYCLNEKQYQLLLKPFLKERQKERSKNHYNTLIKKLGGRGKLHWKDKHWKTKNKDI